MAAEQGSNGSQGGNVTTAKLASTSGKLQSPLKQVNVPGSGAAALRPKLHHNWDALTTDADLFKGQTQAQVHRYFAEMFCLTPSAKLVGQSLDKLDVQQLLGPYKHNMTAIFTHAVRLLKESASIDSRRNNVINTLIPFTHNLLSRSFSNFSFEVMTLLAGSLDRSDAVFADLVTAIDSILGDTAAPLSLRHRTLQLALNLVASLNQGSVTAYFLRRDMFSTLVKFMTDDETAPYVFESSLLLGLLASFRKFEARNPYSVRIEDFVEDLRLIDVVRTVCYKARDMYIDLSDDTTPSFVASLTSLVFSFRLSELLSSFSLSLPPPPPPKTPAMSLAEVFDQQKPIDAERKPATYTLDKRELARVNANGAVANSPPFPPTNEATSDAKSDVGTKSTPREESPFKMLPPEVLVILLPFYDLLNLNKAFSALLYNEIDQGPPTLPPAMISLASYVLCHASTSRRAQAYSRLCLLILMILVEEGEGKLTVESAPVRLCRQRQPMLPHNTNHRPLAAAMLDTAVIFLRHNLRKRMDVETYMSVKRHWSQYFLTPTLTHMFASVCLKLVQRLMQQLKTERIFIVLCYPAYWGEHFLPDSKATALLHYELLHAESTLDALASFTGISSASSPLIGSIGGRPSFGGHPRDSVSGPGMFSVHRKSPSNTLSPRLPTSPRTPSSKSTHPNGSATTMTNGGLAVSQYATEPPSVVAIECVANLRSILEQLKPYIQAFSDDDKSPEDILRVIERNVGGIELIESAAMMDMRRGEGSGGCGHEAYFKSLINVACGDTLQLIPVDAMQ
ncbi:hypothetical protein OIV83_000240 [Microbotryomycetes sp. JL201]|nr:hypothetical protein OIV83_000240 [Microbotryomycetes sp. JL201]